MDRRIKEKLDAKRRNQILAGVVLGATLLLGIIYVFSRPQVIAKVKTEPVQTMNLTSTLNYTSKVQPAGIQSEYAPNQKVLKLHVKVGDRVTEGQLLAELDTSELERMVSETESAFMQANAAMDMANLGMLNPDILSSMLPGMSTEVIMAQLTSNLQSTLLDSVKGLGSDVLGDFEFPDLSNVPALTADQKMKLLDALSKMENHTGVTTYTLADFQLPKLDYLMGLDSIGQARMTATLMKLSTDLRANLDTKGEVNNLPRDLSSLTDGEKEILYNNISTLLVDFEKSLADTKQQEPSTEMEVAIGDEKVVDNGSPGGTVTPGTSTQKPQDTIKPVDTPRPTTQTPVEPKDKSENIIITDLSLLSKQERGVLYSQYGRLLVDLDAHLSHGADVNLPESIKNLPTSKKWELLRELRDVFDKLKKEFDSGMMDFDLAIYNIPATQNRNYLKVSAFGGFNMDLFSGTMDQGGNLLNQLQYANTSASEMLQKAKKEIRAEFNGLVVAINGEEGETLTAAMSTPFIEIFDDRFLTITINANRNDALRINLGQKVNYKIDDMELEGEVIFKSPIATDNSGGIPSMTGSEPTVKIDMDIKGEHVKDLIIGFPIDASIEVESVKNALSIPAQAILRDKDEYYVYVLKEDHIRRRKIEMGVQTQEYVEIKAGLLLGDVVVLNPSSNMQDGQKVTIDD